MEAFWSPNINTIIFSALLMCILLTYAINYRQERGVRYFVWVLVCRVIYAGSVILELSYQDLPSKLFFRNIEQTTLVFMVPLMVMFVLDLLGMDRWLKLQWKMTVLAIFAGWATVIWMDPYLGMVNSTIELVNGHLVTTKTPYAVTFNLFCYAILAVSIYALVRYILAARPEIRKAGILLLMLGSIPFMIEIMKFLKPDFSPWLLPISVYSGICGIFMFWIILRKKIFLSVPIARNVVVEAMQEGFIITNSVGMIIDSNTFAHQLIKGHDRSVLGRQINDSLKPWPEWLSACTSMKEARIEISSTHSDEQKSYIVSVYPYFSQRRRVLGTISVIIDITEKQQALEQIARLNQMKDQLLTAVSHDIRNPLALQVNLVELLEQERGSAHQADSEIIQALSGQIRNTYTMVDNLLEWFRSQKEGIVLNPKSLFVAEVVEEASSLLLLNCEMKQCTLDIQVNDRLEVKADREVLILILRNLLSNAIKFSIQGGTIQVTAESINNYIEISVQDDGVGMKEDQIRYLFDDTRFESTKGTDGEKGTGLGLFVSRQFLRLSGGHLKVFSRPNGGSRFTIVLKEEKLS